MILIYVNSNSGKSSNIFKIDSIDSSFQRLDSNLYAKTVYIDSLSNGLIYIYKLNKGGELTITQKLSVATSSTMFGIGAYTDYNSDGYNDLLVIYGSGARGSNTLNYLFVRDVAIDSFIYIKGSDYAPNLYFDSTTGFIESASFHGGVSFVDYKVIGDSLVEQGGVEVTGEEKWVIRIYSAIDSTGKVSEYKRDSVYDDFQNFFSRPGLNKE